MQLGWYYLLRCFNGIEAEFQTETQRDAQNDTFGYKATLIKMRI